MPKTVLVVEDNALNMKLTVDIMEFLKLTCIGAEDGTTGLALARKERPDLILLDMQLPDISGLEVAREIKGDETLRHIPIIALTASAMRGDGEKFLTAGCDAYVTKPFNMRELMTVIQKFLVPSEVA